MKQQDAFKVIIAGFLVLTMILSVFAYFFIGPRGDIASQTNEPQTQTGKYNPEFWTLNQPFNSISDALNMTPYGAVSADYVDLESMTPEMIQWTRQDLSLISEVDSLYKSNTTKMYYAGLTEGTNKTFLLLSTMYPPKNDFDYIVLPNTYLGYYVLKRQDTGGINVMGTPVIYGSPQTVAEVLQIITSLNETVTAYDQYDGILSKVEPAAFQTINSNVSFADQFYLGINNINGTYERTTAYLNVNASTLKKLNQLKANSTVKGFEQYNINRTGNYTTVHIVTPDLFALLTEETS